MKLKCLAVFGGIILVSGGCAPDRLVSPTAPSGQMVRASEGASVSARPMVIVDGKVYTTENGVPEIDAAQIANIEVLKGDAATRVYGQAGANGVVIITTRAGAEGGEQRIALDPGATFRIRGNATVAAENPLVLVDGVVVPVSALRDIDADDIRDIQVLKGPAAVQQYGDRAADGVVLVRTKDADTVN
ncbi:MAG TPA: TonB-dependent receptor plug domain-containing protein [Longimicrobium sp.]